MKKGTLKEWWDMNIPLVDIRENQWDDGLVSSENRLVVHLPFSSINSGERSCELPPRSMLFGILLNEVTPLSQEDSMEDCVLDFFFATSSKATHQSRKPWNVQLILHSNDELWMDAKKLGIYNSSEKKEDLPQPRLWQPDPLISGILWPILQTLLPKLTSQHCTIWDFDVCFLAEKIKSLRETKSECRIVGFDNHKASAQRSIPFWHRRDVSDFTEAKNLNLNKIDLIQQEIHNNHVICIYAVRFLNRKLFSFLASNSDIQAGTLFAASHFCKPHKDAIWPFDHPKESNVLERDELSDLFRRSHWEIIHEVIVSDSDHGRTMIQFVARKVYCHFQSR